MVMQLRGMTQLMLLMWFLLYSCAVALALAPLSMSAASTQRSSCPHSNKCGVLDIPYPFGIGDDCAWPGFTLTCNGSFSPPKLYYDDIQIIDITLEKGQMRGYTFVAYFCNNSTNTTTVSSSFSTWLNLTDTPFLVAPTSNEFTAIGCDALAQLGGRDDGSFLTGCITTCTSLDTAAKDGERCTGLGCCQVPSIPANLSSTNINWGNKNDGNGNVRNSAWSYSPCSYAFVAEKGWYNFSRQDLSRRNGSKSFVEDSDGKKYVPTVLDWAIRNNGSCSSAKTASACVSNYSECINAPNGEGYLCQCSAGYAGNPYVTGAGGCKNINECDPSIYKEQYPCTDGTCHDLQGSFECKCKFGGRKDSKDDKVCRPVLSKVAIMLIAITCVIAILSILLILLFMVHEKKKLRENFIKNGGQVLKNIGIEIYTKEDIKKITNNYHTHIGNGAFGEVFKGKVNNNRQVAVKRSIQSEIHHHNGSKEDFANEINIQSEIRHKNVVRLVGCCLETNIPMLVFEYIPNGSLHDVLHGKGNDAKLSLTLEKRLAIAIGSAEALDYMHSSASQKILHGDVKSGNILLDGLFVPKVSDFGISRRVMCIALELFS
ncbi:hypothetical protein GUJ93_ZPchr0011g27723 [Zizania palustris]|uniref:Protein kinase domain-containing protein n=1 Tax=Zizania palustris TaxID=103762 RepID=A0A8J5WK90_ZIZPA|nr:hypothetical protein GUJ93_ZPchr0011g27723 [Zizania palustris]